MLEANCKLKTYQMKEKAVISTLTISNPNETVHFQLRIPRDALHVIGVETSVRVIRKNILLAPLGYQQGTTGDFLRNQLFGEITLQSCEKGNIFYAGQVYERELNTGYMDYSITKRCWSLIAQMNGADPNFPCLQNGLPLYSICFNCIYYILYPFEDWTHGSKREEEQICVDGDSTVITGVYRDKTGDALSSLGSYVVSVVVWFNTKI
jgi:hypothetical protein